VVTKSREAPAKKGAPSRASKRLKKAPMASTSLNTHRPVSSADDVSTALNWWLTFYYFELFFSCLSFCQSLMKKFVSLGTKCVKLLKATQASQGKFFCYVVSSTCLICLSLVLYSAFFPLFRATDALLAANARISSLEAKLEASRKAWDGAATTKAAAEKFTKSARAKAKKVEKALADADRARAQREQAITNRLNQISALAGGKYRAFLFSADLLILLLIGVSSLIFYFCLFCFCRKCWDIIGTFAAG
jgi:hypothetical protein